jgi:F-type H+-transporting ATPase subunit delta
MLTGSADLQRLVRSPVFSGEDQLAALEALCAKAGVNGIALNFIKLMAKNRRLAALPMRSPRFTALVAESKGEVARGGDSAEKLSEKHIKDIKAALKSSMGAMYCSHAKVDSSILAALS